MSQLHGSFLWDPDKEKSNIDKHGVDFKTAAKVFLDPNRKIFRDEKHSQLEPRLFCIGKVQGRILTVRFMLVNDQVRIFGAGYWRKGRKYYEQEK